MEVVKLFGLPRTCTNVVRRMLWDNFEDDILANQGCWKHGENTIKERRLCIEKLGIHTDCLKYIICTKSPYSWLFSLWDFENKSTSKDKNNEPIKSSKKTFEEFLYGKTIHYNENPIKIYNRLTQELYVCF